MLDIPGLMVWLGTAWNFALLAPCVYVKQASEKVAMYVICIVGDYHSLWM